MKKLKIIISFLLIFCSITLVSCKRDSKLEDLVSYDKEEPAKNSDSNSVKTISTLEILNKSYIYLDNELSVKTVYDNSFLKNGGEAQYNRFVKQSLDILNKVSQFSELKENTVYTGSTIEAESEDATKVQYLYLTNTVAGNDNKISLVILFSKSTFETNNLNFILYKMDLDYNTESEKFSINFNIENSISNYENNSHSYYYYFSIDNSFYSSLYTGINFYRKVKIDDFFNIDNKINSTNFGNFDYLLFSLASMEKQEYVNYSLSLDKQENKNLIGIKLNQFETLKAQYLEKESAETETENLSETLVPIINSIVDLY